MKKKKDISQRLINLRKENKFTQGDVANALGIPHSTYRNIEHGSIGESLIKHLPSIAKFYSRTIDEIITGKNIYSGTNIKTNAQKIHQLAKEIIYTASNL